MLQTGGLALSQTAKASSSDSIRRVNATSERATVTSAYFFFARSSARMRRFSASFIASTNQLMLMSSPFYGMRLSASAKRLSMAVLHLVKQNAEPNARDYAGSGGDHLTTAFLRGPSTAGRIARPASIMSRQ